MTRRPFPEAGHFREGRAWGPRLLLLGALILAVSGCSLPAIDLPPALERLWEREEAVSEEAPGTPDSMAQPTVRLLAPQGTPAENVLLLDLVNRYNRTRAAGATSPRVTVELAPRYAQRLESRLLEDPPPDVVAMDGYSFAPLAAQGRLTPLPERVLPPGALSPILSAAFQAEGSLLCAPVEVSTLALVYNREIFDTLGQPHPQPEWTWEELRAAAQALTIVDKSYFGMVLSPDFSRWLPFLAQAGGSVFTPAGEMQLESPPGSAAMGFFRALFQRGYAFPPLEFGAGWSGEAFAGGRIAMTIEGNWVVPYLREAAPELDFGVTTLPGGPLPGGAEATVAFANCYAIPAGSRHGEAAADLIAFLVGEEAMSAWTDLRLTMPARSALQGAWLERHPTMTAFLMGLDRAILWQFPAGFQTVLDNFHTDLQAVLAGRMLPDILLNRADAFGRR